MRGARQRLRVLAREDDRELLPGLAGAYRKAGARHRVEPLAHRDFDRLLLRAMTALREHYHELALTHFADADVAAGRLRGAHRREHVIDACEPDDRLASLFRGGDRRFEPGTRRQ